MLVTTLFAASALTPVTVSEDVLRRIFSNYPTWAVREGRSAGAQLEFIVETDGKIRECRIVAFVGSERLANEACAMWKGRKLRPASGADGRPILGLYRTSSRYFLPSAARREEAQAVEAWTSPADIALKVEALPPDTSTVDLEVALQIGPDGEVVGCSGIEERNDGVPAPFVDAACVEARKYTRQVLNGADGQPSAYVTNTKVRFEATSAQT